ncbi:MAG: hypothetical protein HUJ86_03015, partial [Synergistes sp.]|nr:hypothetical protein [Synergistes sp.]
MGASAIANADNTTAVGFSANASATSASALGSKASAGTESTAIGAGASANRLATAIGANASATIDYATAIGYNAKATGNVATALGTRAKASAMNSIALGDDAQASHGSSVALGDYSTTTATYQVSIGSSTMQRTLIGLRSSVPTGSTKFTERLATAAADSTAKYAAVNVSDLNSLAQEMGGGGTYKGGTNIKVADDNTINLFDNIQLTSAGSLDIGTKTKITDGKLLIGGSYYTTQPHTLGSSASAVIGGDSNTATGGSAVVIGGQNNSATGMQSIALGGKNGVADQQFAVAIGGGQARTVYSVAIGYGVTTSIGTDQATWYEVAIGSNNDNKLTFVGGDKNYGTSIGSGAKFSGQPVWGIKSTVEATGTGTTYRQKLSSAKSGDAVATVYDLSEAIKGSGSGQYSYEAGEGANAPGAYSTAVGYGASADAWSVALGSGAEANGNNSIAIGRAALTEDKGKEEVSSYAAIAIGEGAHTVGKYATAIGTGAEALALSGVALGYGAQATQLGSLALGTAAVADNSHSVAIGIAANTSANWQVSIGKYDATKSTWDNTRTIAGLGSSILGQTGGDFLAKLDAAADDPIAKYSAVNVSDLKEYADAAGGYTAGKNIGIEKNTISLKDSIQLDGYITVGSDNTVSENADAVIGGQENAAANQDAIVIGGLRNTATGEYSEVIGGYSNKASGLLSASLGGISNEAAGSTSLVLGGGYLYGDDERIEWVSGDNAAKGRGSVTVGGMSNTTAEDATNAVVVGGAGNTATGNSSLVLGGGYVSLDLDEESGTYVKTTIAA